MNEYEGVAFDMRNLLLANFKWKTLYDNFIQKYAHFKSRIEHFSPQILIYSLSNLFLLAVTLCMFLSIQRNDSGLVNGVRTFFSLSILTSSFLLILLGYVTMIKVTKTKNDITRKSTISDKEDLGAAHFVREYLAMRPQAVLRFFVGYRNKKCNLQLVSKNTFGKIPNEVAEGLAKPKALWKTNICDLLPMREPQ